MTQKAKITVAELRALKPAKRSKYGNKKVVRHGINFDSIKEANRYDFLLERQRKGEISGLEAHPVYHFKINGRDVVTRSEGYPNGRRVKFTPDARYNETGVGVVVEDTKSPATNNTAYRLRKAIFECLWWPCRVIET